MAITSAMSTRARKSMERLRATPATEAPSTLRIPISLVLFSAVSTDSPNNPMQEIRMVSAAPKRMISLHLAMSSYCLLFSSLLNT